MIKTEDIAEKIEETKETEEAEETAEATQTEEAPTEALSEEGAEAGYENTVRDYEKIVKEDLNELRSQFPELSYLGSIMQLENPLRYAELRDLGLTAKEAYLATSSPRGRYDNRRHLDSSVPKNAAAERNELSSTELSSLREVFGELGDRELQRLYKKVSSQTK